MITNIPSKEDFYATASHMVNEAWENLTSIAHEYIQLQERNEYYVQSEYHNEENLIVLDNFWNYVRPKLISALALVQQSVEFRLKGLIVEISPYLLITNASKNIPKFDENGNIPFSSFHTLDAQDLFKVHHAYSETKIEEGFFKWYSEMRLLRNTYMHTVELNRDISVEMLFESIITAHNYLNKDYGHWIWSRYNYRSQHASNGIQFKDMPPGNIFEMLPTHVELTSCIKLSSNERCISNFGYNKNNENYFCKLCVSVMEKSDYFDSKYLDECIGTIQYNQVRSKYVCIFCQHEQLEEPVPLWGEEN